MGVLCAAGAGVPLMAAGGGAGVVTVWNLEERRLATVIRDAHDAPLVPLPGVWMRLCAACAACYEHACANISNPESLGAPPGHCNALVCCMHCSTPACVAYLGLLLVESLTGSQDFC